MDIFAIGVVESNYAYKFGTLNPEQYGIDFFVASQLMVFYLPYKLDSSAIW